jgi:hypothetical protein
LSGFAVAYLLPAYPSGKDCTQRNQSGPAAVIIGRLPKSALDYLIREKLIMFKEDSAHELSDATNR